MVQKVIGFKAQDGKVFDTEELALAHEKTLLLGNSVLAAILAAGYGEGDTVNAESGGVLISLKDFLLNNSELLVDALTPPKKERKPRAPKEPVAPSTALTGALEAVAGTVTAPVVAATPVAAEAGTEAEDELAALLGGTVATEVAV